MVRTDVVSQGGNTLFPNGKNLQLEDVVKIRKELEAKCLSLLECGGVMDEAAAHVAATILELFGHDSYFVRGSIRITTRRAVCAVRLLLRINEIQDRVLVGHQPHAYPQTKEVLWRAFFRGYFRTKSVELQELLGWQMFKIRARYGLTSKEESEDKVLARTLKDTLLATPPDNDRLRHALSLVREDSNETIARALLHRYASNIPLGGVRILMEGAP